jgi:hypothetical protein
MGEPHRPVGSGAMFAHPIIVDWMATLSPRLVPPRYAAEVAARRQALVRQHLTKHLEQMSAFSDQQAAARLLWQEAVAKACPPPPAADYLALTQHAVRVQNAKSFVHFTGNVT